MKISARLLIGFLLVIAMTTAMGLYAMTIISRTTAMTGELYDRPLMASNFALSALVDFVRLDRMLSAAVLADGAAKSSDAAKAIAAQASEVGDDLAVVEERFPDPRGAKLIGAVKSLLGEWSKLSQRLLAANATDAKPLLAEKAKLLEKIEGQLDILIEAAKEEGFNFRQRAVQIGDASYWMLLGALGLTVTMGIVIALAIARSIARPVTAITATMSQLAGGNTDITIPAVTRRDEVGEMAKAVEVFKQNALDAAALAAARAEEQASKERRSEALADLTAAFDMQVSGVIETVATAAVKLTATAQGMAGVAGETSQKAMVAAGASEEASASVQTVAAATEELATSIAEISHQVAQSTSIAERAVGQAERTNGTVVGLADAAQQIGEVVQLIQNIAAQTNLLALNATIEAARAGEAGKGFAVVAGEVKSLAAQTAKATEQISAQIDAIRQVTGNAVSAIKEIGGTIGEINKITATIAASIEQQGAATSEIARNVQQAATGTCDVATNIGGVMQATGVSQHSATEVLDNARALSLQSDILRNEVRSFLEDIRAA